MDTLLEQRDIQDVVFGPFDSRRLGRSLGINLLPRGARTCNFDCVYCECAAASWPAQWELRPPFPTASEIHDGLAAATDRFGPDELDCITIAGNGEPTLSPQLDAIVDVVNQARDRDWPQAKTVILSNGTMCHSPAVRAATAKLDERIIKLDAGNNWILEQLNRPLGRLTVPQLLRRISMMPDIIIQSMFVHGPIDNTGRREIAAWAGWLTDLKPAGVQIYSLERRPAKTWVRQVAREELQSIAEYVETNAGIPAYVF